MQVTAIYAGTLEYSNKLEYIFNIFNNTCKELGVNIQTIDITKLNIEYFSGKKTTIMENIFNNIKSSSGVIFICTAKLFSVCGAMQVFLEHFDSNSNVLKNKPCYSIVTSIDGSEFNAGTYLNTVINFLEGNSIGNMLVGREYLNNIEASIETTNMIERYAEDFYRFLKQNRKLFHSKPFSNLDYKNIENTVKFNNSEKVIKNLNKDEITKLYEKEINNNSYINKEFGLNNYSEKEYSFNKNNIYSESLNNFNNSQESDINEITKLLTQEYKNNLDTFNIDTTDFNTDRCKQRTKSLHHYFQPQIAKGMNITIQINIMGKENFKGYLKIENSECSYFDGYAKSFDVEVIADSKVWEEVLDSKYTLQKAFMLGKVKVKGNFVIISKFEQIFKL